MTVEELLCAKDCGREALHLLGNESLRNELLRNIIPGKCLVALANRWECNGGGTSLYFTVPKDSTDTTDVSRLETKKTKWESAPTREIALDPPHPGETIEEKLSGSDLMSAPSSEKGKEDGRRASDVPLIDETIGKTEVSQRANVTVETVVEESVTRDEAIPMEKEIFLSEGTRQLRERKAVKSDDAEIPEYLWEEHLMEGSKVSDWNDRAIADL
jgi:hypothetical protein